MPTKYIMTDYLEGKIINHMFKNIPYSAPPHVYLALYNCILTDEVPLMRYTEVPEVDTNGNDTGYSSIQCPEFTIVNGVATSSLPIEFEVAKKNWGNILSIALLDTQHNILFYGVPTTPITILEGDRLMFSGSSVSIGLEGNTNGGWGNEIASTILNFILNNDSFPTPGNSIYLALGRSVVTSLSNNLTSWLEISGPDYSRKNIPSTAWTLPDNGYIENIDEIIFTENALTNWGSVANSVLFNSSSGGDPLLWGVLASSKNVLMGDGFKFKSGNIAATIDFQPPTPD